MENIIKEEKNNKIEAETLIDYAKTECNDLKIVLPMLNAILTNKKPEDLDGWNWKLQNLLKVELIILWWIETLMLILKKEIGEYL